MPIARTTTSNSPVSTLSAVIPNIERLSVSPRHISADDNQHALILNGAQNNLYGSSVININNARVQRVIQTSAIEIPSQVRLDELNFTIGKHLGSGGQARVYALVDQYGRNFAGKTFYDPRDLEKELKNYADVGAHPNIAQCYGEQNINGKNYLVMERVDGKSLADIITNLDDYCRLASIGGRKEPESEVSVAPALRLMLLEQLVDVLHDISKKEICHADLKPENILVTNQAQIKLIDFGLKKAHQDIADGKGTLHYTAPEVLEPGTGNYAKADGYAAANTALKLSTGFYLSQSGKLLHLSERHDHGNYWQEKMAGKDNFVSKLKPQYVGPGASGYFAGKNSGIDEELFQKVIQPLQDILPEDRADIEKIWQEMKEMAHKYLPDDKRAQAVSLFQRINGSTINDTADAERQEAYRLMKNLLTGLYEMNYAKEHVNYVGPDGVHEIDMNDEDVIGSQCTIAPDKNGIVMFNPEEATVELGPVPPSHKQSIEQAKLDQPTQDEKNSQSIQENLQRGIIGLERLKLSKAETELEVYQRRLKLLQQQKQSKLPAQEDQKQSSVAQQIQQSSVVQQVQQSSVKSKGRTPLLAD